MSSKVQYPIEARSAELRTDKNGRLIANWQLTDTALVAPVKITVPPKNAIPILFVPGIMGSNLCDMDGKPVWLLNSTGSKPIGLAVSWSHRDAGVRQKLLHPAKTKVYGRGNVPEGTAKTGLKAVDFLRRGWGEVSEASYHKFLLWLDEKLNSNRDPASWQDFSNPTFYGPDATSSRVYRTLPPGLVMTMQGLPIAGDGGKVAQVSSDELLKRAKSIYPVYAYGYNWLDSNLTAADGLKSRIEAIIAENNGPHMRCTQVIVVTHSMGGLVARACAQLQGMSQKILGIVHGVMPATGAAVAYRRCKVGMRDESYLAGLVIGSDGKEVSAVFAQSPGALQLLPSEAYGEGWLNILDPQGNSIMSLPKADPYKEIYLERKKWWGLIREEWLAPKGGAPVDWEDFAANILTAQKFHRRISNSYHPNSFVFYGAGLNKQSFQKIRWFLKKGKSRHRGSLSEILDINHESVLTDGSNDLRVGREYELNIADRAGASYPIAAERFSWEIHCGAQDSEGDGTVPATSGRAPREGGGKNIHQQFAIPGIEHEPAYQDSSVAQQVAHYAITKLSALADLEE